MVVEITKIGQRVAFLEQVLKKAKDAEQKADVPAYKGVFREFYGLLRSTWERSVEELLFNQVVQRYEKEVRTLSLSGVNVDTESVETVFKGMTRSSAMIDAHDHPAAENPGLPGFAELGTDLEEFKAFIAKQKAKNTAAEKAHAHLKKIGLIQLPGIAHVSSVSKFLFRRNTVVDQLTAFPALDFDVRGFLFTCQFWHVYPLQ